ncbi:tetratricopeptide repeat protein [Sinosporangium siamense]|uniref:Uncharacterized protein n=1 Tax=Sinosporangium siamense TaxID=1367973 RepID=A0A919RE05_9ACTN|nr:tetratricopeptide repeat protein [Sinosporangium siamense]GII91883.1 hypothetical protein Ssi02_21140 [Sinosporangium siamense]
MRQEHDNIRAALNHCLTTPGQSHVALELLSALWFMWVACGLAREGRLYLERALKANPQPSKARCKALWVMSYVCSTQGDITAAMEYAEQCSAEAVRVGDSASVILATKMQGTAAMFQGDLQKATALLGVAIDFHRGGNERELNPGLLPAIVELSFVLTAQNEPREAESLLKDCLKLCKQRGELWLRSHAHWATAEAQVKGGRTTEACASVREGLRIKLHFHDVIGTLMCLETMARVSAATGNPRRAAQLFGAADSNWKLFGLPLFGSPFLHDEHTTCVKECKRDIGEDVFLQYVNEGMRLTLEEAVTLALDDEEDPLPRAAMSS